MVTICDIIELSYNKKAQGITTTENFCYQVQFFLLISLII